MEVLTGTIVLLLNSPPTLLARGRRTQNLLFSIDQLTPFTLLQHFLRSHPSEHTCLASTSSSGSKPSTQAEAGLSSHCTSYQAVPSPTQAAAGLSSYCSLLQVYSSLTQVVATLAHIMPFSSTLKLGTRSSWPQLTPQSLPNAFKLITNSSQPQLASRPFPNTCKLGTRDS